MEESRILALAPGLLSPGQAGGDTKINDEERRHWVMNDEGLYSLFLGSWERRHGGVKAFVRNHRALIDAAIHAITTARELAHYIKYHHGAGLRSARTSKGRGRNA